MGLFSKNKQEDKSASMPPAPPMPPSANFGQTLPSLSAELPPAPGVVSSNSNDSIQPIGGLPTPPVPRADLDEIKNEVYSKSSYNENMSRFDLPKEEVPKKVEDDDELDSLFDISDLDIPSEEDSTKIKEEDSKVEEEKKDLEDERNIPEEFIEHHKKIDETKPFFITTSQFKALLEIVDSVKSKTKDSHERHLRLLDIKAEEDIEYENLKKDFTFIEDKLYELDNLIFEND